MLPRHLFLACRAIRKPATRSPPPRFGLPGINNDVHDTARWRRRRARMMAGKSAMKPSGTVIGRREGEARARAGTRYSLSPINWCPCCVPRSGLERADCSQPLSPLPFHEWKNKIRHAPTTAREREREICEEGRKSLSQHIQGPLGEMEAREGRKERRGSM